MILLTNSMEQNSFWEADSHSASQEIPHLLWNITMFTRAHYTTLSWVRRIQSIPLHPISLRCILILSSYLNLGLSSGPFPSDFPNKTLWYDHDTTEDAKYLSIFSVHKFKKTTVFFFPNGKPGKNHLRFR